MVGPDAAGKLCIIIKTDLSSLPSACKLSTSAAQILISRPRRQANNCEGSRRTVQIWPHAAGVDNVHRLLGKLLRSA